jgi:hypothetical protein
MDVARLKAIWSGEAEDAYAEAAITGTLAIALKSWHGYDSAEKAQAEAETLWRNRNKAHLGIAA